MSLDTIGRDAADALHERFDVLPVPRLERAAARHRHRVGARAALGATAMVVAIALVAALVVTSDGSGPVRTVDATSGWQQIALAGAGIGKYRSIHTVTAWRGGFVAGGYTFTPNSSSDDPTTAAIWTSRDGRRWKRAALPNARGAGAGVDAVAATSRGLVAIGRSVLWTSRDGRAWKLARRGSGPLSGVQAVTRGGPGLLAYGYESNTVEPAIWASADGRAWRRVLDGGVTHDLGKVVGVARAGDGWLAMGSTLIPFRAVAWTSPDAITWTRFNLDVPARALLTAVLKVGDELLAGTWDTRPQPQFAGALLRSADRGRTWDELRGGPTGAVAALTRVGRFVIATGAAGDRPAGWVSTDLRGWTRLQSRDAPPGGVLNLAAARARTLVVFSDAPELEDFYVWEAPRP